MRHWGTHEEGNERRYSERSSRTSGFGKAVRVLVRGMIVVNRGRLPTWTTIWMPLLVSGRVGTQKSGCRSASHLAGVRQDRNGSRATSIGPHHRQPIGQDDRKRGSRGYDAGKKVKGRGWHILTDIQDRDDARLLLNAAQGQCPRVSQLYADGGHKGALLRWIKETVGWRTERVRKPSWK